ncbi:MAG TPA: hypothetical protein VFB62_12765 [Polyangiaceae bacterium]|jgi:hypothetical protein|nr:hypothetical protein [Polyangiaceae bacterium]
MTTFLVFGVLALMALPLAALWKNPRARWWLSHRLGVGVPPHMKALTVTPSERLLVPVPSATVRANALVVQVELGSGRIESMLRAFAPVRIHLTPTDEDTRFIEIESPDEVLMVPDRGVFIRSRGKLHYRLAGLELEREIRSLQALLIPSVVGERQSSRLAFDIEILETDIAGVPTMVDDAILKQVNGRLDWRHTQLAWNFGQALSTASYVPERIEPLDQLITRVGESHIDVTADGIRFEVEIVPTLTRLRTRPTTAGVPEEATA